MTKKPVQPKSRVKDNAKVSSEMQTAVNLRNSVQTGAAALQTTLGFIKPLLRGERPASELAHLYGTLRDMSDALAESMKPLEEALAGLGEALIPAAFERENLTSFTTKDGYRVTVSKRYLASIVPEAKAAAYDWLRKNGLDALITETVNAQTLSKAGYSMLKEDGKELPEDFFRCYFKPGTSLTRAK